MTFFEMEKGLSELEEVKLRIVKAENDLERAKNLGNIDLELKIYGVLELLLEEKKRLTTNASSVGNKFTRKYLYNIFNFMLRGLIS